MNMKEVLLVLRKKRRTLQTLGTVLVPVGYGLMGAGMAENIVLAFSGMGLALAGLILLGRSLFHYQFQGLCPALRELALQESGLDRRAFLRKLRRERWLHWGIGYLISTIGAAVMGSGLLGGGDVFLAVGALVMYIGMVIVLRGIFHDSYWGLRREWKEQS